MHKWFNLSSWLWFNRDNKITVILHTGEIATYLNCRQAWFGPALRLLMANGEITHGWDPACIISWRVQY